MIIELDYIKSSLHRKCLGRPAQRLWKQYSHWYLIVVNTSDPVLVLRVLVSASILEDRNYSTGKAFERDC